jgi:ammonium transporter Rh
MMIGFGFLMSYLRNHSWSSLGFSFFIIIITVQYYILWAILWQSINSNTFSSDNRINTQTLTLSMKACFAVLISYGAVLGKVGAF